MKILHRIKGFLILALWFIQPFSLHAAPTTGTVELRQYNGTGWVPLQVAPLSSDGLMQMTSAGVPSFSATPITSSLNLTGTAGAGFLEFATQSSDPTPAAGKVFLWQNSGGRLAWSSTVNSAFAYIFGGTITASRTYTLPDNSTTLIGTVNPGAVSIAAGGSNQPVTINSTGTAGVIVKGTSTNDSAATGYIGEYISASVAQASPTTLTTGTGASLTSVSLGAGDWDVSGSVGYTINAATTVAYLLSAVSSTSASYGTQGDGTNCSLVFSTGTTLSPSADIVQSVPIVRFSLATTTSIYLVVQASFGVNSCKAYGFIRARRVR